MPDNLPDPVISDDIKAQLAGATTPEAAVAYNIPKRADQNAIDTAVQGFEIRGGPADATAYHDFYRLHIAFEHVWTEIFDSRVGALGQMLYEQYVQLKDPNNDAGGDDGSINSVEDLQAFMNKVRSETAAGGGGGIVIAPPPPGDAAPIVVGDMHTSKPPVAGLEGLGNLTKLLGELDKLLSEKSYAFDIFAPNSINFGMLVNYRQEWKPLNYQVGNLVSTIPLAPQEVRRYTSKLVVKKTRNVKEIDDSLRSRKEESSQTSRTDAEIVQKALNRTNFQVTASETFGNDQAYKINASQSVDQNQSKESAETKREFRETVLKVAQEYRDQHRVEVTSEESSESESTSYQEIKNPNDELPVTYLFYELQRSYQISEKLHKLTPVVLVANDVPWPNEIDESWLITHDWILKRAILDDSFLPALDYLSNSFVGAEVALQILGINMQKQKEVVDRIGQQVKAQNAALQAAQGNLDQAVQRKATDEGIVSAGSFIKSFFDPLGLTQSGKTDDTADRTMIDAAKDALDRAQNAARQLLSQLETELTTLQAAANKFASAVQEHFNRLAAIDRLRIHVKDNILYYMQAIWSHEPPDQRYFRLYNLDVPIFTHHTRVQMQPSQDRVGVLMGGQQQGQYTGNLAAPALDVNTMKLNEVADLDNLLGFKGNYMIFPLKQYNYLTYYMMQDYIDVGQTVTAKDPDEFGNYTLDQLEDYMAKQYGQDPATFRKNEAEYKKLIIDYLTNKPKESEVVIVPTTSLYIEALPGTHPLLEDFKLIHRAIDVKKAQAEVRHAELENLRAASRVLKGNDEDPDIEKKILVEGGQDVIVSP